MRFLYYTLFISFVCIFSLDATNAYANKNGVSESSDTRVQCPPLSTESSMGPGGGRSSNPENNSMNTMGEAIKAYEKNLEKLVESAEDGLKSSISDSTDWLDECIAGLNSNIFSGNFSGIFNKIVESIKKKICNFTKRETQNYLNEALNMISYDLPFGLGTIGANSNIMGFQINTTNTTGSISESGVGMSPSAQRDAGIQMFERAGGILMQHSDSKLGGIW